MKNGRGLAAAKAEAAGRSRCDGDQHNGNHNTAGINSAACCKVGSPFPSRHRRFGFDY